MFFRRALFIRDEQARLRSEQLLLLLLLYGSLTYIYWSITYAHVTPPLLDDRTAGAREKYDSRVNAVALYYYY